MASKSPAAGKQAANSAPAHASTRERILAYLHENRFTTVQALSRAWGLTRADIRYHFKSLLEEGAIELVPRSADQPAPRGRPEQLYRLAAGSLPDNFPALCAALLDALLCPSSRPLSRPLAIEEREPVFRSLADRLAGNFVSVTSLTQRITQASDYLSQHGYRARWEAHARGPRILLRSCPYAAILPAHPELCILDRFLLERLVQVPFQQTAQINLSGGKPAACIFIS